MGFTTTHGYTRINTYARISSLRSQFGSGKDIVYLDHLSHATIAKNSGPKRWCKDEKKLSRILKDGGTVVINVDTCDPKQLLTLNSIESRAIDGILHGIGDGHIQVHTDCKFIFVGETINHQQVDFRSRGNWASEDQLRSLIGKIEPVSYTPPHSNNRR